MQNIREKHSTYPEVTVGALIFNDSGELFLMKTHKWKGMYCVPGGHIELGETAVEAVIREVKEETNLKISDVTFHCIQDAVFPDTFYEKRHFIFIDFVCRTSSDTVKLNEEASEYVWVSLNDIQNYNIEPFTLKTITLYMNPTGKRYISNKETLL